jgi:hypothetical protein
MVPVGFGYVKSGFRHINVGLGLGQCGLRGLEPEEIFLPLVLVEHGAQFVQPHILGLRPFQFKFGTFFRSFCLLDL